MSDLTEIIEDSLTDATLPTDPIEDAPQETPTDDITEVIEPTTTASETIEEPEVVEEVEVNSPATKETETKVEDFDKRFGLAPTSPTGRENRIPYSRVRKITEKAEKDAASKVTAEYQPKLTDYETRVKDYETKVKGYEDRLMQVSQIEEVMMKDQPRFLQMLTTIPGYSQLLAPLFQPEAAKVVPQTTTTQAPDDMPLPDSEDGMTYTKEGLKTLLSWNAKQAADLATKRVEERYAPIETQFNAHQRVQALMPQVQKQIEDARTWPQFNESEPDIVKALQADQSLSLERAYQQVVFPKLIADRNKMREDVLKEIKQAPRATSTTSTAVKAKPVETSGPRSLEDVINQAIKEGPKA